MARKAKEKVTRTRQAEPVITALQAGEKKYLIGLNIEQAYQVLRHLYSTEITVNPIPGNPSPSRGSQTQLNEIEAYLLKRIKYLKPYKENKRVNNELVADWWEERKKDQ